MKEHTTNELTIMLGNLENKVEEKHEDIMSILNEIKTQTIKTNGRVSELEKWRYLVVGAISILTALILPLIFLILKNLSF